MTSRSDESASTGPAVSADEAARNFLSVWHEQIHHGWAAAIPALTELLTTHTAQVRADERAKVVEEAIAAAKTHFGKRGPRLDRIVESIRAFAPLPETKP